MSEHLPAPFESSVRPGQRHDCGRQTHSWLPERGEARAEESGAGLQAGPRVTGRGGQPGRGAWGMPAPGQAFHTFSGPGSRRATPPPEARSRHPLAASLARSRVGRQGYGVQLLLTPDSFEC